MISVELLQSADRIMNEPRASSAGVWPRAAALLARQAIETARLEFWLVRAPGVEWCTTHAQLLCLPDYVRDREIAESASLAWNSLSRVCHHIRTSCCRRRWSFAVCSRPRVGSWARSRAIKDRHRNRLRSASDRGMMVVTEAPFGTHAPVIAINSGHSTRLPAGGCPRADGKCVLESLSEVTRRRASTTASSRPQASPAGPSIAASNARSVAPSISIATPGPRFPRPLNSFDTSAPAVMRSRS